MMKVFQYKIYDKDFKSARKTIKNERTVNVLAIDENEAKDIMKRNYPENGIGKNIFEYVGVACVIHHFNTPNDFLTVKK